MAAKTKSDAGEALKQLTYLAAALKAPRITARPSPLENRFSESHTSLFVAIISDRLLD